MTRASALRGRFRDLLEYEIAREGVFHGGSNLQVIHSEVKTWRRQGTTTAAVEVGTVAPRDQIERRCEEWGKWLK
jgi:hypothetical protein